MICIFTEKELSYGYEQQTLLSDSQICHRKYGANTMLLNLILLGKKQLCQFFSVTLYYYNCTTYKNMEFGMFDCA